MCNVMISLEDIEKATRPIELFYQGLPEANLILVPK